MVAQTAHRRKAHGTRAAYYAGCRCNECRAANAAYQRRRDAGIRAGTWDGLVDPGPAREWALTLHAGGWSRDAITAQSGAPDSAVATLLWDRYNPRGARALISAVTSEAILGVTWGQFGAVPDLTRIPSVGSARRLQALARVRWPMSHPATMLGTTPANLRLVQETRQVTARRARAIALVYSELVGSLGPSQSAEIRAETKGWAAPWQWDGVDIDDPRAEPLPDAVEPLNPRAEKIDMIADVLSTRPAATWTETSALLGATDEAIRWRLRRAGRMDDLGARLTRNGQLRRGEDVA